MIHPRGERILVTRIPDKPSIIHLTDAPASRKFTVLAIGPDVYDVNVGDTVLLPGLAADEPDFAKDKEALVHMNDVGCKVG